MTRSQRIVHRALWPALGLLIAFGVTMALVLRPPPEKDVPQAVEAPKP
jgi:hypothetical protein